MVWKGELLDKSVGPILLIEAEAEGHVRVFALLDSGLDVYDDKLKDCSSAHLFMRGRTLKPLLTFGGTDHACSHPLHICSSADVMNTRALLSWRPCFRSALHENTTCTHEVAVTDSVSLQPVLHLPCSCAAASVYASFDTLCNFHVTVLSEPAMMADQNSDAIVNRDEPLPILRAPGSESVSSDSPSRTERVKHSLSASKLKDKLQDVAVGSKRSDSPQSQPLQDRLFSKCVSLLPPLPP